MDTTNNIMNNDFANSVVKQKTSFVDTMKSILSNKKKTIVTVSSFLVAVIMTGSVFYIAYKTYNERNVATDTGAANPSCYIELSLNSPTPSPTPIACTGKLDIMLVIDRSSTMTDTEADGRQKLAWAKDAAKGFVQALINSGTTSVRVGVSSFGSQGNDGTGAQDSTYNSTLNIALSSNFAQVMTAIDGISYVHSGTCIECGIRIANSQLTSTTNKRVEILLSDGMANHTWDGIRNTGATAAAITQSNNGRAAGLEYRVLGYGIAGQINETTLKSIAGSAANYQYKPNVADWSAAFLKILADICSSPVSTSTATPVSSLRPSATPTVRPSSTPTPKPTATPAAPTSFISWIDTYVSKSAPTVNYGTAAGLKSGGPSGNIAYVRFDLTQLLGRTISNASLNLNVTDASTGTFTINSTTNSWTESALNYNNKPANAAGTVKTFVAKTLGNNMVDITTFVNANKGKVVTLVISTTSTDTLTFNSRETATGKPTISVK